MQLKKEGLKITASQTADLIGTKRFKKIINTQSNPIRKDWVAFINFSIREPLKL